AERVLRPGAQRDAAAEHRGEREDGCHGEDGHTGERRQDRRDRELVHGGERQPDGRAPPFGCQRQGRESAATAVVARLEGTGGPGAVVAVPAPRTRGRGVVAAPPADVSEARVLLRPDALEQRFRTAVAALLAEKGPDRRAAPVPDNGRGTEPDRPTGAL